MPTSPLINPQTSLHFILKPKEKSCRHATKTFSIFGHTVCFTDKEQKFTISLPSKNAAFMISEHFIRMEKSALDSHKVCKRSVLPLSKKYKLRTFKSFDGATFTFSISATNKYLHPEFSIQEKNNSKINKVFFKEKTLSKELRFN